jgi:hypothetical protein
MPENQWGPSAEDLKRVLQEAVLRNYPNPDRIGCPGAGAIRELARVARPFEDTHWEHVSHCSPCYREFLEYRTLALDVRKRRRTLRVGLAAVAAVVLIGVSVYAILQVGQREAAPRLPASAQSKRESPQLQAEVRTPRSAILNFENESATRGVEVPSRRIGSDIQHVPRDISQLIIYLPLFSEPGKYEVRLLRSSDDTNPLATFTGTAQIEDGLTVVKLAPDLSHFQAGTYTIAFRRDGGEWRFSRVVLG